MARRTFTSLILDIVPPWLNRTVGSAIMKAMGTSIETVLTDTSAGVRLRFPDENNPEALGFIGRQRRILRGPGESDSTFAGRVLRWWDAHRGRGGPYELLRQLHEFFLESNNVPIQVVANSGLLHSVDTAGSITRGSISGWTGDGEYPSKWARIFVVFNLAADFIDVPLLTESGEPMTTEDGEPFVVSVSIYSLTDADREILCAVPREWDAAHIDKIYIVLIPGGGIAWGLPPGTEWGDPGLTWGGGDAVTFTC